MPLSEIPKVVLLKDTFGVVQQSSRAFDTTSSKLPEAINTIAYESIISERILPIQPPPTSQPISIFFQPISELVLLSPPTKTPIIEPIIETPKVSETQSQQQH